MIKKKFTAKEAATIRYDYKTGVSYEDLIFSWGASKQTIQNIVNLKSYKHYIDDMEDDYDCGVVVADFPGWTVTDKFIVNWQMAHRFVEKERLCERGWIAYYYKNDCNAFGFARAYMFALNYFKIDVSKIQPYKPDTMYEYTMPNDPDGEKLRNEVEANFKKDRHIGAYITSKKCGSAIK